MNELFGLNPALNKDTLVQQVYLELKRALLTGQFKPGQRVTVRQITEIMGVSTTPVREALGRIVQDRGLHYAGPKTIEVPVPGEDQFRELGEIRIAMESCLAPYIIANSDQEFVSGLEETNKNFSELRQEGRYQEALVKNMEFHFALYAQSRRLLTIGMLENIWLASGPTISLLYPRHSRSESGVAFHNRIIDSVRKRDADRLRTAMVDDIRTGYSKICSVMTDGLTDA